MHQERALEVGQVREKVSFALEGMEWNGHAYCRKRGQTENALVRTNNTGRRYYYRYIICLYTRAQRVYYVDSF